MSQKLEYIKNGEKIRKYSYKERFRYTKKKKWFCKKKIFFLMLPYVASDFDIYVDYIWRDLQVKNLKKKNLLKNDISNL